MQEDGVLECVVRAKEQMQKVRPVGQVNVGEVNLHVLEVEGIVELVIALVAGAAAQAAGAEEAADAEEGVAVVVGVEISSGMEWDGARM
jgi:hypothetical protein